MIAGTSPAASSTARKRVRFSENKDVDRRASGSGRLSDKRSRRGILFGPELAFLDTPAEVRLVSLDDEEFGLDMGEDSNAVLPSVPPKTASVVPAVVFRQFQEAGKRARKLIDSLNRQEKRVRANGFIRFSSDFTGTNLKFCAMLWQYFSTISTMTPQWIWVRR